MVNTICVYSLLLNFSDLCISYIPTWYMQSLTQLPRLGLWQAALISLIIFVIKATLLLPKVEGIMHTFLTSVYVGAWLKHWQCAFGNPHQPPCQMLTSCPGSHWTVYMYILYFCKQIDPYINTSDVDAKSFPAAVLYSERGASPLRIHRSALAASADRMLIC